MLAEITNEISDHRKVVIKIEEKERNRLVAELSTIESGQNQILTLEDIQKEKLDALKEIDTEKKRLNFESKRLE